MSEATVVYNDETGLFRVETAAMTRNGLSKAEANSLAAAINSGKLEAAQLCSVGARDYLDSGQSRAWDNSAPAGTSAQKG
jgi:hypothetical protein